MVFTEWLSPHPKQGMSIWTPLYYHIYVSCRRILFAFRLATASACRSASDGLVAEIQATTPFRSGNVRPIPILAWVPLAIMMFCGLETPVIFLATLASFS